MQSHQKYFQNNEQQSGPQLEFSQISSASIANKENIAFGNLGAEDGYPAFLKIRSESDGEYDRIRTYSYDPEKSCDESDWTHKAKTESVKQAVEPKHSSLVISKAE